MENMGMPASPIADLVEGIGIPLAFGFSKREPGCISLRLPNSGDFELDAPIRIALRRDFLQAVVQ